MTEYIGYRVMQQCSDGSVGSSYCWVGYRRSRRGPWRPLEPRLDLGNHSPTGFEWGYGGSGPQQLALALVAHVTGDDTRAKWVSQRLKQRIISRLPHDGWKLSSVKLLRAIEEIENEERIGELGE